MMTATTMMMAVVMTTATAVPATTPTRLLPKPTVAYVKQYTSSNSVYNNSDNNRSSIATYARNFRGVIQYEEEEEEEDFNWK